MKNKTRWVRSELPSGSFFLVGDRCTVRVMSNDRQNPYDTKSRRGWSWSLWVGPKSNRGLQNSGETATMKAAKTRGLKAYRTCARRS